MKLIRRFISKWTKPYVIYVDSLGYLYALPERFKRDLRDYPFVYQRVKQGFWGNWYYESEWYGRPEPLPVALESKTN